VNHISFCESSHWEKKKRNSDLSGIMNMSLKSFYKADFSGTLCRSISGPGSFSK